MPARATGRAASTSPRPARFRPSARATGAILHLDASGALTRVAEGIHYANGVAVSPDGATLYASEHLERRVLAFDIAADGTLSNRRTFVALDDLVGADPERSWEVGPDGLNVDRDGNLIIAEYGAGQLLVVDKDGKLVATIAVPERYVTASAFNADQTRLFITAPASLMDPSLGARLRDALPGPGRGAIGRTALTSCSGRRRSSGRAASRRSGSRPAAPC